MKNNVDIEKGGFVTNKAGKVLDKYKIVKEVIAILFRLEGEFQGWCT